MRIKPYIKTHIKPYKETHMEGVISLENIDYLQDDDGNIKSLIKGTLGIQIAEDGRIWVCIDGIAFIRFRPKGGK